METDKKALSRLKFVIDSNAWINAFFCEDRLLQQQCGDAIIIALKKR
jgi:hypothetical protein